MIETTGVERGGATCLPCHGPDKAGTGLCRRDKLSPDRARLEHYVRQAFANQHSACVDHVAAVLFGLEDADGRLRGVAGVTRAADGPLFLEQYLNEPVEHALTRHTGYPVCRDRVAEIGNLATAGQAAAAELFSELADHLATAGTEWAVFTATRTVRFIFGRLGVPLTTLAKADPARLGEQASTWGKYYRRAPLVVAAHVGAGRDALCGSRDLFTPN